MPDSSPEQEEGGGSDPEVVDTAEEGGGGGSGPDGQEAGGDGHDGEERVGETIDGRYHLEAYLGGGGMGDVYRAEHQMMKKTVALKVLRPDAAEEENIVERFRREAQAAAHLDHPKVCSATDFGETETGAFYLVMEYVPGETLQDVIDREGPLEPDRAVDIAAQIAGALRAAHELEIVHRDLKPENVMLAAGAEKDDVRVLDFGVARVELTDDTPSLTKTGAVFGTPDYMSPEQASGDDVDHRADLYGLGSVLFEMLTARSVFEADESVRVMAKHLTEPPPHPRDVDDDVPRAVDALVVELLAKERDDRPSSAAEVEKRLEAIVAGEGARSPAATSKETLDRVVASAERAATGAKQAVATATDRVERVLEPLPVDTSDVDLGGRTAEMVTAAVAVLSVLVLGLGALVGVYLLRTQTGDVRAQLRDQRTRWVAERELEEAVSSLEEGESERALTALEDVESNGAGHLAYLRGRAHAEAGDHEEAVEAYRSAVSRNGDYLYAEELADGVVDAALSGHEAAESFVVERGSAPPILDVLGRAAWETSSGKRRRRAQSLLREHELMGQLPEWQRRAVKLRRAEGCEAHRTQIEALAELAEPEGLAILRIYADKPRSGCGTLNTEDCYGCIREDLAEAIERLESQQTSDTGGGRSES